MRLYGDGVRKISDKSTPKGINLSDQKSDLISKIIEKVLSFQSLSMANTTVQVEDQQKGKKISFNNLGLYLERQRGGLHAIQLTADLNMNNQIRIGYGK